MSNTIGMGDALIVTTIVLLSYSMGMIAERLSVSTRLRKGLPAYEAKRTASQRHTRSHG